MRVVGHRFHRAVLLEARAVARLGPPGSGLPDEHSEEAEPEGM